MAAIFFVAGIIALVGSGLLLIPVFRSTAYVDQIIPALSLIHSQSIFTWLAVGMAVISAIFFSTGAIISALRRSE